jgi:probable F420-dependent oxidoreductase
MQQSRPATLKDAVGPFGIFTQELCSEEPSRREEIRQAAAELERLGFGAIWLGGSSSVRHAAHLIEATSHIVLATGILNIWFEDPGTVAPQRADLEAEHPGRFLLGLGASHAELARNYQRPYSAMVDYLDGLDAANPPVPSDRRVLAALGPKMLGLARDRAAGAHPYLVTPEYIEQTRQTLGENPFSPPRSPSSWKATPARLVRSPAVSSTTI